MTGLVVGFREALEAAIGIVLILAAVRRLGHGHLAQLVWYGSGTGLLLGLSVAAGLASARTGVSDQVFVRLQLVSGALALLALSAVVVWMRRRGKPQSADPNDATEAPGAWLVTAVACFAVMPPFFELVVRMTGLIPQAGLSAAATSVAGLVGGGVLGALLYKGLLHCRPIRFFRSSSRRELAAVVQHIEERG